MKKLYLIFIISLMIVRPAYAQFKEYPKLNALFSEKKFQECIDLAIKINAKEARELNPVLLTARSYYELYQLADEKSKLSHLRNSLKFAGRIDNLDKKKEKTAIYADFMDQLHKSSLEYAVDLFESGNKDKSKPVFEYLARIFADTSEHYYSFYPDQRKKQTIVTGVNVKNEKVNQLDNNGKKQGFWTKVYPNGNKAYEVYFKDDIPVGEYKRYHENGKLSVFINYDEKGEWGDAKIYNEKEILIATGKYHGRLKHGQWLYYMDNIKVAEDNFVEGKRNGVCRTFFKNGKVSDERNFTADIEDGVWRQYYPSGKVKLETRIDKGIRNSVYYVYHENGKLETRGRYKNDHMDGEWIYYDEKGLEMEKVSYVMGKAANQKELDEKDNKYFLEMEKNRNRLMDPANYITNPDEYLRANGLK
jgi:antitoxin component YwqK of YwqJK toxin-antitoxin module